MTITAKVLAHSLALSETGQELITWELEYPRIIHAQVLTHRMFSRNSASSRAIPVKAVLEQIKSNMAKPSEWGKNRSGMASDGPHEEYVVIRDGGYAHTLTAEQAWDLAACRAMEISRAFSYSEYHKQVCNRLTEPFQHIKVVLSTTDTSNFYKQRLNDADPTMMELARAMHTSHEESTPRILHTDEWHLPYQSDDTSLSIIETLYSSIASCAQVSYRNEGMEKDKANRIVEQLLDGGHYSPFEHIASPIYDGKNPGVTHYGRDDLKPYSGNFKGWIQYRHLL